MKYEEQGICFYFKQVKGCIINFNGNISIDSGSGKIDAFSHFRLASCNETIYCIWNLYFNKTRKNRRRFKYSIYFPTITGLFFFNNYQTSIESYFWCD